jgi:4Fe-4S ferredoxin
MKKTIPAKVKRASQHRDLPAVLASLREQGYSSVKLAAGEPGAFRPNVDASRCEGKDDCAEVCPFDVFDVGPIDINVYSRLSLMSKVKLRVHGMRTATAPRADACHACGLCVVACPERAIELKRFIVDAV